MLVLADIVNTYCIYIIQGRTQTNSISDIACSRFKSSGGILKLCALECNVLYHISITLPGLHLIQQIFLTINNSDTGGSEKFMSEDKKKIRLFWLKVHTHMRDKLSTIQ